MARTLLICGYGPGISDGVARKFGAGLLHHKLAGEGIYVGSVVVLGLVKGTAFDQGGEGLEPAEIGEAFWTLAQARDAVSVNVPG